MRAHKPTAKGKADAVSRARMLMKSRLWWLDGFPGDGGWTALPLDGSREVETLALDRTHLRRATLTINELRRDFPRALGRIVGDGARWVEASHRVVSLVKPWVHGGGRADRPAASLFDTDLFPRAVREQAGALAAECPALAPSVGALSWLLATRGQAASRYVRFLARNRDALARIADPGGDERGARDRIVLVLRLAHLGVTAGESLVAPLVAVAADRRADTAPLRDAKDLAGRAAGAIRPAARMIDRPPADPIEPGLPGEVASWVVFLCSVDATVQRRFLRLLAACDLTDLIAAWSAWWADHAQAVPRALEKIHDGRDRVATADVFSRLRAAFEQQVRRRPPSVHERKLGRALRSLSADAFEPCAAPARAVLARLPAQTGLRAAFLVQWAGRIKDGAAIKRLVTWLTQLRDYLAATGATEEALSPLAADARTEAERNRSAYCLLDELDARPADHLKRFFAGLAALHARRPEAMGREMASRVDELAEHVREPELIAALAAALHDAGQTGSWLSDEVARGALALERRRPGRLRRHGRRGPRAPGRRAGRAPGAPRRRARAVVRRRSVAPARVPDVRRSPRCWSRAASGSRRCRPSASRCRSWPSRGPRPRGSTSTRRACTPPCACWRGRRRRPRRSPGARSAGCGARPSRWSRSAPPSPASWRARPATSARCWRRADRAWPARSATRPRRPSACSASSRRSCAADQRSSGCRRSTRPPAVAWPRRPPATSGCPARRTGWSSRGR